MDKSHGLTQRMRLHKRQRVTETVETTTTAARGRTRTSATELAAAIDTTSTSAATYHLRPSFLTASTRATSTPTVVAPVASTSSVTTLPTTQDDTTTSSVSTPGTTQTTRARVGTTSASPVSNVATGASQSTGFNAATATPINASPKANSAGSSSHGGAVAGAIIAVIAVLAVGIGFFVWRKRRNNRLMRDGLIGGNNGNGGNGFLGVGGYKKQDEGGQSDTWEGGNNTHPNDQSNGLARDDSSLFGGREKTFSQESFPAGNGYGATAWNTSHNGNNGSNVQQPNTYNNGGPEASWNANNNAYPPMNQQFPPSTVNLLSLQQPSPMSSNSNLPASLAVGAGAGAAGIGAARLLAAQSSSPPASISHFDPAHQSIEQRELQQELENRRQSFLGKTAPPVTAASLPVAAEAEASPFGESEGQGEIRVVKGTFDPSLDDELVLYPGDKVQVLMKYDDGWALGLNLSSGVPPSKGVFPFDCLGEQVAAPQAFEIRKNIPSPISTTAQRSLSPVNPANIPLPPPTPTLLIPINEDEQEPPASSSSLTREGPPQLAPFERSDSPLSPDFPPSSLTIPSSTSNHGSPTKATKLKRHSSLIASRDADLFVALGEVLDKEKH